MTVPKWSNDSAFDRLVMKSSLPRLIYNVLFWGVALFGLYTQWHWYEYWNERLYPVINAYTTVLFLVVGGAILIFLNYLREAVANVYTAAYARMTGKQALNYEKGNYARNVYKSAAKLKRRGDFAAAAEVYETVEEWEQAAEAYEKAGMFGKAAAVVVKLGDASRALGLYEREGDYESAASLAAREGLRECAQRYYRLAAEKAQSQNRFQRAAEMYERAGSYERAGQLFEMTQKPEDALRCYDRAGSAEAIVRLFKSIDTVQLARKSPEGADLVRRCAETVAAQGMKIEAASALEQIEEYARAGEIYSSAEEWEKAGEAFLLAGLKDKAVEAYRNSGDPVRIEEFLARVAVSGSDWGEAGRHFEAAQKYNQAVDAYKRAKDFHSAARVYETMKRYIMAAEMYASAKDLLSAARAYAKAPDWRNAGECYEAVGELSQAMEAYVNSGLYMRAGVLALQLNDVPKAIEYLQRVPPTSPDSKMATAHLASAFYRNGRREMARDLFRRVLDQIPMNRESLPIFYSYGRLLEEDLSPEALTVYHQMMGVDVAYEDVAQRIARLEEELARSEAVATSGGATGAYQRRSETGIPTDPLTRQGTLPTLGAAPTSISYGAMPTIRTRVPTETVGSTHPTGGPWRPVTQAPETRFGEEGRYQIIKELGRGGMAIVYKALDQHLEREVALKTFPLSRHAGPGREEVFLNEARLVARLSHPNIVTIYDSGHMNFLYYIAMEFVDGENLKQRVKRKGPLALEEARSLIRQVADALHYAHSQQVLHLDVKPGNVIVRPGGHIKVVDFGLSKILSDAATSTPVDDDSQRTLVGTPQYMAPEQILGQPVDPRTDVYSLGLTLFYVLTGRTPFEIKKIGDPLEISRMQVHASFPRPSTINATLPSKVDDLFVRCTQKSPADRYQTVADFLADFDEL